MSSVHAARQAASANVNEDIVREEIFAGPIIRIRVSTRAVARVYEHGNGDPLPYLQFPHTVKGGCVNFFVHTDDDSVIGAMITAKAIVMKKVMSSGREYLYIDLEPVPADTEITHRLGIMPVGPGSWDALGWPVYRTLQDIEALLIFGPPDAKFVPNGEQRPTATPKAPKPRLVTGDSQLDRLLADGWEIESEDTSTVSLARKKKGELKTMTHHRPKPAGADKKRRK